MGALLADRRCYFTLALCVLCILPAVLDRHLTGLMVFASLYSIAGLGVGLLLGQCGIINLAQSAFYGIGAYATAYCTTVWGLHPIFGIALGIVLTAGTALIVGWPILRLTTFFLALATLAIGTIGTILFFEWDWITGGTLGVGGIPALSIAGFEFNTPTRFYYLSWSVLIVLMLLAQNLVSGRPGLAMRAVRDAAPAAEGLGVDIHGLRVRIFVLGATLGSLAGSLFAHYVTYVSVESFTVQRSVIFLLIPVIAGARTIWGVLPGAIFVTFIPEWLTGLGDIHATLFGALLVAVVIFLPEGLSGLPARVSRMLAP
jgi:branched-chain amino acid transport system permease protein